MMPLLEARPHPARLLRKFQPLHKFSLFGSRLAAKCPSRWRNRVLEPLLNHALDNLINEGELDFLQQRTCAIQLRPQNLRCVITLDGARLRLIEAADAEVTISSSSEGFLNLITQRVDPDTLFFRRELQIEGDVELGLYIKNMLDALDTDELPPVYRRLMQTVRQLAAWESP